MTEREVSIQNNEKIYSAKNIPRYRIYDFEFPWEKKAFDQKDIHCKNDTYWFDPVEFDKKIVQYMMYRVPTNKEISQRVKYNKLKLFE